MRVSRLMLVTLRDTPSDAEIASHQLLARGGFIRRVASGIYAYMPLMSRVLQKITSIVQQEMNSAGALQTLLPQLHPAEIWERSGRWQEYTAGEGLMFNLKDRQGRNLGLGPTHEEVITTLAGEILHSYRQLPVNLYQIQTKFRDEIRPRFGLMRSREFIMKDAYSFHATEEGLKSTYSDMDATYKQIFDRCGIKTVAVEADSGSIGGAASQEFMVTAETGEDLILKSSDGIYAANQEKAISVAPPPKPSKERTPFSFDTPNQENINSLCVKQELFPSQILKVILMIALLENNVEQPILVCIRGDQELNEVKLVNILSKELNKKILDISIITDEALKDQDLSDLPFGSIGPDLADLVLANSRSWNKYFHRVVDHTALEMENFVCGSNQEDRHLGGMNWTNFEGTFKGVDIRKAKAGDRCIHDENQKLEEQRGIEVGHIFQLGRKYSKALQTNFTNEKGIQEPFWMGCYGIGISRLAQAAVEQNHDDSGITWPISIAPFEVIIVIANMKDNHQVKLGEKIYSELKTKGIDALLDDRSERAGVKFKDADLIGIPWRIVVGRDAASGQIELVERSNKQIISTNTEAALTKLLTEIFDKRR